MREGLKGKLMGAVIFDTTRNAARCNFSLANFCVVGSEMRARWVASALLEDEAVESFHRAFADFHKAFGSVTVILADEDGAIEGALASNPGFFHHGLRGWHLSENIGKNIKPHFSPAFRESVVAGFFEAARAPFQQALEELWPKLNRERLAATLPPYRRAVEGHLAKLYSIRRKWARWHFAQSNALTLFIESAQRSESMHRRVKAMTNPNLPLCLMLDGLLDVELEMVEKAVRLIWLKAI